MVQLYFEAGKAIGAMPLLLLQPIWVSTYNVHASKCLCDTLQWIMSFSVVIRHIRSYEADMNQEREINELESNTL